MVVFMSLWPNSSCELARCYPSCDLQPAPINPNLAVVIDAWPSLQESVRRAVIALLEENEKDS